MANDIKYMVECGMKWMEKRAEGLAYEPASRRSILKDFLGGVDPTGTQTFQYGLDDGRAAQSSGFRRGVGVAGGVLGGGFVVPAAVGAIVEGGKGFLGGGSFKQRMAQGAAGMLRGAKDPFEMVYRGYHARKGLKGALQGKAMTRRQQHNLDKIISRDGSVQALQSSRGIPPGMAVGYTRNIHRNPAASRSLYGIVNDKYTANLSGIGVSSLVGSGSAYLQYGRAGNVGGEMRRLSKESADSSVMGAEPAPRDPLKDDAQRNFHEQEMRFREEKHHMEMQKMELEIEEKRLELELKQQKAQMEQGGEGMPVTPEQAEMQSQAQAAQRQNYYRKNLMHPVGGAEQGY
jgi:hypothetical protein